MTVFLRYTSLTAALTARSGCPLAVPRQDHFLLTGSEVLSKLDFVEPLKYKNCDAHPHCSSTNSALQSDSFVMVSADVSAAVP
jgi:hypothetical protein